MDKRATEREREGEKSVLEIATITTSVESIETLHRYTQRASDPPCYSLSLWKEITWYPFSKASYCLSIEVSAPSSDLCNKVQSEAEEVNRIVVSLPKLLPVASQAVPTLGRFGVAFWHRRGLGVEVYVL